MNGAHLPGVGIKLVLTTRRETSYFLLAYLHDHSCVFPLDVNVPFELFELVVQKRYLFLLIPLKVVRRISFC